jgi:hypothetical protein
MPLLGPPGFEGPDGDFFVPAVSSPRQAATFGQRGGHIRCYGGVASGGDDEYSGESSDDYLNYVSDAPASPTTVFEKAPKNQWMLAAAELVASYRVPSPVGGFNFGGALTSAMTSATRALDVPNSSAENMFANAAFAARVPLANASVLSTFDFDTTLLPGMVADSRLHHGCGCRGLSRLLAHLCMPPFLRYKDAVGELWQFKQAMNSFANNLSTKQREELPWLADDVWRQGLVADPAVALADLFDPPFDRTALYPAGAVDAHVTVHARLDAFKESRRCVLYSCSLDTKQGEHQAACMLQVPPADGFSTPRYLPLVASAHAFGVRDWLGTSQGKPNPAPRASPFSGGHWVDHSGAHLFYHFFLMALGPDRGWAAPPLPGCEVLHNMPWNPWVADLARFTAIGESRRTPFNVLLRDHYIGDKVDLVGPWAGMTFTAEEFDADYFHQQLADLESGLRAKSLAAAIMAHC